MTAPRCAWRDCLEPATWSLGFGRDRGVLLFADYCGAHADDARRLFRVEACRRAQSVIFVPADAHPREPLEAATPFVLDTYDIRRIGAGHGAEAA